ncbi:DAK2 domain-containing protein [Mycoplasma todarodis]|uniref:Dihydroxyacetone kinase n=1 Tax=Mycoplasma todarodis TaxID=1937191 RepID=A0A4R0XUP5_9MOLU|nr:DAK2 domain-containing protein [Mycoplasma todarodis]TCG10611.1 dihydroxyacetone kinase [Mycoplasma todarodis]
MKTLNGTTLKEVLTSGVNAIRNDANRIDALNVFPVPDGDTGSNMSATAKYAAEEIATLETKSISEISAKFARGMLLGARGNSGVILSQILKGFSVGFKGLEEANGFDIVRAFGEAKEYAYKSVMKPVEGTILTVIRETATSLEAKVTPSMTVVEIFSLAAREARKSVNNTPNLLPVLKEVGVVDSGGEGLFQFLNAMAQHLEGKPTVFSEPTGEAILLSEETFDGEFGYCTEAMISLKSKNTFRKEKFEQGLNKLGNSAVVVVDEEILKVHIHALKPGTVLNFIQKFGEFFKIKVENMTEQATENKAASKTQTSNANGNNKSVNIGVVSCNVGQGIINDMKEYGADFIIEGGQTMNPSASDIIKAINAVDTDKVIILPNNSNIILAAQQAAQTITDKKVVIVPTKTQMQGISAIINFDREGSLESNKEEMTEAISATKTVQVTKASRTTRIEGVKVIEGEYLSIADKTILGTNPSSVKAAIKALKSVIDEDAEIVTIYFGDDSTKSDASEIASYLENNFDVEIEIKTGDQPVYNFLIAVE